MQDMYEICNTTYDRPLKGGRSFLELLESVISAMGSSNHHTGRGGLGHVVEDASQLVQGWRQLSDIEGEGRAARKGVCRGLGRRIPQRCEDAHGRGRAGLVENGYDVEARAL